MCIRDRLIILLRTLTLHYPLLQNCHVQNLNLITLLQIQQNNLINYKQQYITQLHINSPLLLCQHQYLQYYVIFISTISTLTLASTWTGLYVP